MSRLNNDRARAVVWLATGAIMAIWTSLRKMISGVPDKTIEEESIK
jgi:hypothetical protein